LNESRVLVPGAARLALGDSRAFAFERDGERLEGFVLRHEAGFFAYLNRCPHWAVDLDLGDGRFYAADLDRIYCKNHGALFRVQDGMCDHGPCMGVALHSFPLQLDDDDVWVNVSPEA
jgi:nitrite reductase/ring-hydroxylating ferredoxin subunit